MGINPAFFCSRHSGIRRRWISGIQGKSGNSLDTGSRLRLVRHDDCVVAEMMTGIKQMAGTEAGPTAPFLKYPLRAGINPAFFVLVIPESAEGGYPESRNKNRLHIKN